MQADKKSEIRDVLGAEQPRTARHGRRWLVTGVALVAITAVTAGLFAGGKTEAVRYKTQPAQKGDLTVTVTATGNLAPTNQVDVGSELSGIIKSVDVDYNDQVKVGQVLAELDTSTLEAQLQQSKATLASARAQVLQAEATARENGDKLDRLRRAGERVSSKQDLDSAAAAYQRAQADVAIARASVALAEATLQQRQSDLSKAVIRSPISGIVLVRNVEPGQTVAASLQAPVLFTLAEDLAHMELHVDVDEADVGHVKAGQEATFNVDAYPDRTFHARITQVRYGSKTVEGVVTYETVLNVDNSDLALRPGMTATASIVVRQLHDVLLVPSAALRFTPPAKPAEQSSGGLLGMLFRHRPHTAPEGGGNKPHQQVWTLRNGRPVSVPVKIGASDGRLTEITGGAVTPGMALIVDATSPRR